MKKVVSLVFVLFLLVQPAVAQQPLPIRRILLYKNGMAYIVRSGEIRAPMSLKFLTDEMSDVLKSLTAWNPDNSTLYPVGYTTGIAADHMLRRFPFDLRSPSAGVAAFLVQIKGASLKLDLGNARTLSGQLLAIVEENRAQQQQTLVTDHRLTILTAGKVQTVWLSDVRSFELEDPNLSADLKAYLQVLSDGRQDVTRDVTVYPTAAGPINVAYVQQFPVWKTTYRIDLDNNANHIQGWSQIDNPTGEPWSNVDLTLVSGMPTSFMMNLYEPLYTSRQTVRVPASVAAAPRQYEAAINNVAPPNKPNAVYGVVHDTSGAVIPGVRVSARDSNQRGFTATTDERGYFEIANLAPGFVDVSAEVPGFQRFSQSVQLPFQGQSAVMPVMQVAMVADQISVTGIGQGAGFVSGTGMGPRSGVLSGVMGGVMTAPPPPPPPPPAAQMRLQSQSSLSMQTADASRTEDYFEYRFPFPIQLDSRQSALLPFLNKPIDAERVSIFKAGVDRDHPLSGAWIKNNDELPLEPGPITFFQNGKYSGETVLDYLSRGERRLVSYGVDYDIQAETNQSARPETIAGITVSRGVLIVRREAVQTTRYKFRNKGKERRSIVLEHPRDAQRTLKDLKPEETSASFYRFRIAMAPNQEIEFPVSETISRQMTYVVRTLDRPTFELLFSGSDFPAALRTQIADIMAQRERLADLQSRKAPLDATITSIFTDQDRLRENLKALGNRKEDRVLHQKYVAQLDAQEQQVRDLRARVEDLNRQIAEQENLVAKMISDLTWT